MLKRLFGLLFLFNCSFLSAQVKFPSVIDFRTLPSFHHALIFETEQQWTWQLGDTAYELGFAAFNDAPEIATFVAFLQKTYQLDAAVETGTFYGATSLFLSSHFNEVYTIDITEKVHLRAKERLKNHPNIHCILGSSDQVLEELLPALKNKSLLFYIDAHMGSHPPYLPVIAELEAISKTHRDNCILIFDDFRVPNSELRGISEGNFELSHESIQYQLSKIFTDYTVHYLIPKESLRSAKFVAIPKKWQNV